MLICDNHRDLKKYDRSTSQFPESGLWLSNLSSCLSQCFGSPLISLGLQKSDQTASLLVSSLWNPYFLVPSLRLFSLSFRDVKCGKIHCSRGKHSSLPEEEKIYHLKKVSKKNVNVTTECKTFSSYRNSKDLGLVASGTKCGDKMVRRKPFVLLRLLVSVTRKHYFL